MTQEKTTASGFPFPEQQHDCDEWGHCMHSDTEERKLMESILRAQPPRPQPRYPNCPLCKGLEIQLTPASALSFLERLVAENPENKVMLKDEFMLLLEDIVIQHGYEELAMMGRRLNLGM